MESPELLHRKFPHFNSREGFGINRIGSRVLRIAARFNDALLQLLEIRFNYFFGPMPSLVKVY